MKIRNRIIRYETDDIVPPGAIYLATITREYSPHNDIRDSEYRFDEYHYFLVPQEYDEFAPKKAEELKKEAEKI